MTLQDGIRASIEKENLSIEVTTRCTQTCVHCFARAGRGSLRDMALETARQVLADGRAVGFRHLHITGGEPLLWPPLHTFIDEALEQGYESVFLNTNGALLDETAARNLSKSGTLTLSVSIQGPERLHDAMRGAGSYAAAASGLRNALDAGIPACIFTTGGQSLLRELPRFAEAACREFPGIKDITLIQLIRVPGDAFDLSAEILAPGDFLVMVRMAAMLNLYGLPVSILENPLASAAAHALGMPWLPQAPPPYRPGKLVVMADGSITPAHSSREQFGRFAPGALEKILGSEPYLRAVAPDGTACPACPHLTACREKGMMRPSEPFRDHVEDVPFCRRVMDLVVKG